MQELINYYSLRQYCSLKLTFKVSQYVVEIVGYKITDSIYIISVGYKGHNMASVTKVLCKAVFCARWLVYDLIKNTRGGGGKFFRSILAVNWPLIGHNWPFF